MRKNPNSQEKVTRYTVHVSSLTPPMGLSPLDHYRRTPGHSLPRTYEMTNDTEEKSFPKDPDLLFVKGVAMGRTKDGAACPFEVGNTIEFIGFLIGQTDTSCIIKTRGSAVLRVDRLSGFDHGRPVFVIGPNQFSLDGETGGVEIGSVRYTEDDRRAAVAFRRTGDPRPLSLAVRVA